MPAPPARLPLLCLAASLSFLFAESVPAQTRPPAAVSPGAFAPNAPQPKVSPALAKLSEQFSLALKLQNAKKDTEAIAAYKTFLQMAAAAKLTPQQTVPAYKNLALLYNRRGDMAAQSTVLRQVLQVEPRNTAVLAQLAAIASGERRFDEATQYARRALQQNPPPALAAPAHYALGAAAAARQDYATAEKEFGAASRLAPDNPQAYINYAVALGRQKKFKLGLAAAEKAAALSPNQTPPLLLIAFYRQQLKDYNGALAGYEAILQKDARNQTARFNRAAVLQEMGRAQEAISGYLDVLTLAPNDFPTQFNVAQLYYQIGAYSAAKQHYAAALRLAPKDLRSISGLALSETQDAAQLRDPTQRAAGFKQAENHFQQALAQHPNDRGLQDGITLLYERMGRYEDAIALFRKRIAADPGDIAPYRQIARLYVMQHKVDAVVETWKTYRAQKPNDPTSYAEAARILEAQGRQEAANAEWSLLLERHPNDGNALLAIAQNLTALRRGVEARAQFKKVLALDTTGKNVPDPKFRPAAIAAALANRVEALRGLAQVAQAENKFEEAIAWWKQVKAEQEAQAPRTHQAADASTYRALAYAYEQSKKPDLAIKELQTLAELQPKDPTPYVDLARLYDSQEKVEEAVAAYRKAAERATDPLDYRLQIAALYRRRGKIDPALAEYEAIQAKAPKDIRLLSPLAQTYEQAGKDEKALATYDALLKTDPGQHWVEGRKAIVLTRLKRYPEARTAYERLLELNPDDAQTYSDLARLYADEGKADAYLSWLQKRFEKSPARRSLMAAVLNEFVRQKREEAGWVYLHGIVEKPKPNRVAQEALASLLSHQGHTEESLAVYRQIAEQNPNDLTAQTTLAEQLDFANKKEEANHLFETLIARPSLSADQKTGLRRQLAERYDQQGKKSEAIVQYQEVLKAEANDFQSAGALARLLTEAGRDVEAIPLYAGLTKQTAYPPEIRAQIMARLGSIYEKRGAKTDAIGQYREALKLNPNETAATEGLKRLGEK